MEIQDLVQPHIRAFKPYSSARDEYSGKALQMMDANENSSFGPFNRYPDPYQKKLKDRVSKHLEVSSSEVFLSNGSDESIDLIIRLFCKPFQDAIIQFSPTYGMYSVCASVQGVRMIDIQQSSDFKIPGNLSFNDLYENQNARVLFLCNPNNPTGQIIPTDQIIQIASNFKGIVVVDEAYIEFSDQPSCTSLIEEYPNIIVLRTFSKAWGMAGLRLGMAISNTEVIKWLSMVKMPYNVNAYTQDYALRTLAESPIESYMAMIKEERDKIQKELSSLTIVNKVYESQANFILAVFNNATSVFNQLKNDGIIVRDRSYVTGCENCLRISIGTPIQNQLLINTLKSYAQ